MASPSPALLPARHSCVKLLLTVSDPHTDIAAVFVRATWHPTRFTLAITDGARAWTCDAKEAEVSARAEQWEQPVGDYLALLERYLGYQQPGSTYAFREAGYDGSRRLSWTFERQGTKLEWRWKCQPATNQKETIAEILDFLMDANIRLSEEVVRKNQSFDKLKREAEACLQQSEKFKNEKAEFEAAVYSKFVAVLNSKKAKLRDLRDQITKLEATSISPKDQKEEKEEDESSGRTEIFDEGSDAANTREDTSDEEAVDKNTREKPSTSRASRGRKKARR